MGYRHFLLTAAIALCASNAYAEDEEPSGRERVSAYYSGLRIGIAPGVWISSRGGPATFTLAIYGGYGFDLDSVIVVPGASITGAFPPDAKLFTFAAENKLVLPIDWFAPFIDVGVGPAYLTPPGATGLLMRGGVGFTMHPSVHFAFGVSCSYLRITNFDISSISIAPIIALSF